MQVLNFIEMEDGSATLEIDLTAEETRSLLEYAFIELIKKGIDASRKDTSDPA